MVWLHRRSKGSIAYDGRKSILRLLGNSIGNTMRGTSSGLGKTKQCTEDERASWFWSTMVASVRAVGRDATSFLRSTIPMEAGTSTANPLVGLQDRQHIGG